VKLKLAEVQNKIENKLEFSASGSMDARKFGHLYVVYSYVTPIAIFDSETGEWQVDVQKYSVTTAKHRGIVLRAAKVNEEIVNEAEEDLVIK